MSAPAPPLSPDQPPESEARRPTAPGDRRFVLVFGALVMLLTTLPYLLGYSFQGSRQVFSGFVFGVDDGNSYIAKMLAGWAGSWVFRTPYTAYPQGGLPFFYLPYLLLGKLAAPPGLHIQLVALFHLFRIGAGMLMILATYDFLARFIAGRGWRRLGLLLAVLGGGLGWLLVAAGRNWWLGSLPLDFYSPEAFGFLSLFGLPHLAMARALMLWALLAYLDLAGLGFNPVHQGPGEWGSFGRVAARLSGLWLAAGLFNPLTLALVGVVILVHLSGLALGHWVWRSKTWQVDLLALRRFGVTVVLAGLLPGVYLVYNFAVSRWDSYASAWTAQNIIRSPNFVHYLLAYGLLVPFAWFGARRLIRGELISGWLPVGWVLVLPLLAYAPLDLQRRLTEGVWVAWCVLALVALDPPGGQAAGGTKNRPVWRLAPLLLAFPSTIFLLIGGFMASLRPAQPIFLPADEAALFQVLQEPSQSGAVVLSSFETGNAFPAWAPVRVLAGHGPESIHLAGLMPQIEAFYRSGVPDEQRLELIQRFKIRYVFWGPSERRLGDWQPASASYLQEVARRGEYTLYQVRGFNP